MQCLHFGAGASQELPLVIVHGLFGSARNWRSIAAHIAAHWGVPTYAVDLRNHGGCALRGPIASWQTLTDDLGGFVRAQLGEGARFRLLGHSLGGLVCEAALLGDRPGGVFWEGVGEVVVVDVGMRHPSPADASQDRLLGLLRAMQAIEAADVGRAEALQRLRATEPDAHVVNFLMGNARARGGAGGPVVFDRLDLNHLADAWPLLRAQWARLRTSSFHAWPGRALFMRGAASEYVSSARGDYADIRHFFPRAEIVTVPNSGHWPHFDNERAFLQLLARFLGRASCE